MLGYVRLSPVEDSINTALYGKNTFFRIDCNLIVAMHSDKIVFLQAKHKLQIFQYIIVGIFQCINVLGS